MQKSSNIGGQAVMEGIMMRNGDRYSVAVRKPDGQIETKEEPARSICPLEGVNKIPILRGAIAFIDSLVIGTSSLMWSAEFAAEDEEDPSEPRDEAKEAREWKIIMTVTVIISVCFSVGLFMLLPYGLASILRRAGVGEVVVSLTEAFLRITIFALYMFMISRMKDNK
jgi:uncharacterized protein YqhQ